MRFELDSSSGYMGYAHLAGKIETVAQPDYPTIQWNYIEVNTLEELLDLVRNTDRVIVSIKSDGTPAIEIYDTYRE